ncbi:MULTISPECIES: hypothetical protein [unclassified Lentimonas]|uniref:hypothetical protein n=1 Tax=unclassified Lentimonas TaxID=2630993 RepID=UPI00138A4262|nr:MULTISPECIES: hypothetical protein [unclassified Lentimonas]
MLAKPATTQQRNKRPKPSLNHHNASNNHFFLQKHLDIRGLRKQSPYGGFALEPI